MIHVHHVSKLYRLYSHPLQRIREILPFAPKDAFTDFWALRDITLETARGETLGIVGPNGCGKSTLLQIICGILQPTTGRVVKRGRIAALLELGAGFNPEFTGHENVFINGEIMGLSRAEIARAMPSIEAFAGIGDFMKRPVKEYSSGMYVRLAFSTAIHVEPEILVVDEALAVGDAVFANRCVRKLQELRARGVTVLFVSHDLGLVKQLANRAILLHGGRILAEGHPKDVVNQYIGLVLDKDPAPKERTAQASFRHGDRSSRILHIELLDRTGEPAEVVACGEPVTVRIVARFSAAQTDPMAGILIRTRTGLDVYGTNTRIEETPLGPFAAGEDVEIRFRFDCWLTPQEYTLTVATQHADGTSHDWLDEAISFEVAGASGVAGLVDLRAAIDWRKLDGAIPDPGAPAGQTQRG